MKINSISISNWKSIIHTKLLYQNLLILIGANSSGKTALMSALSFFFDPESFSSNSVRDRSKPMKISIEFVDESGVLGDLSIETDPEGRKVMSKLLPDAPDSSVLIYTLFINGKESTLTCDEFKDLLKNFIILEISSFSRIPHDSASIFMQRLINFLEKSYPNLEVDHDFLKKRHMDLADLHVNKSVSRKLLFESFKYLNLFVKKNKIEKIENLIIFIQNPELFLNPQEEREFFDYLIKLSNIGVHIVIETHSSRFVGLKQYHSIVIVKQHNRESSYFQYRGKLFSGDEIKNFNMNYWINTDRGELFFAKKIILVEGQTDKMLLNYLGNTLDIFRYEYTIIECGSKSLIPQFIKLCNCFRIPYVAVYDRDNHAWRNELELQSSNDRNRVIQKSIDYSIGQYVEFANDIEEEIYSMNRERRSYRNKPFNALKTVMDESFILPKTLETKIKKIWN